VKKPSWYVRSLTDGDTHCGELRGDGLVVAACNVVFPAKWLPGLTGWPPDPGQVCPECERLSKRKYEAPGM